MALFLFKALNINTLEQNNTQLNSAWHLICLKSYSSRLMSLYLLRSSSIGI